MFVFHFSAPNRIGLEGLKRENLGEPEEAEQVEGPQGVLPQPEKDLERSLVLMRPVEDAMALGGVEIGRIIANDAHTAM